MVAEQIEREVVIAAPVERVWAVLTEAEHIGAWFGDAGAEIDLRPAGALAFHWRDDGCYLARVECVEPPRLFSYRWACHPDEQPRPGNSTLVEFTLSSEGAATRLRVVERGFAELDVTDERRAKHVEENTQGWQDELDELRAYVEQSAA